MGGGGGRQDWLWGWSLRTHTHSCAVPELSQPIYPHIHTFSLSPTHASAHPHFFRSNLEFSQYVRDEGYQIIPIKHEHQLAYACNVLNLGEGRLISVHAPTARQIVKFPSFRVRGVHRACTGGSY